MKKMSLQQPQQVPKAAKDPAEAVAAAAAAAAEGEHDSGVDESTQGVSPKKTSGGSMTTTPIRSAKARVSGGGVGVARASTGSQRTPPARSQSVPRPFSTYGTHSSAEKKVSMNKIKVGMSNSPNLRQVQSKIGSLNNAGHRPGGGDVKIESKKLEWKASPKTQAVNEGYTPKGGEKKIESRRLNWNAQSKIGSLDNTTHKAGGGEVKIASQKLTWKADSKVGSKDYINHKPGGGQVKIPIQKVEVAATSKIGSMANMKHKPGGGDVKVFNDVEYLRQKSASSTVSGPGSKSGSRRQSASQLNSSGPQSLVALEGSPSSSPKLPAESYLKGILKRKTTPEPPLSAPMNPLNIDI